MKTIFFLILSSLNLYSLQTEKFIQLHSSKQYKVEAISGEVFIKISSSSYSEAYEKLKKNGYYIERKIFEDWYLVKFSTEIKLLNSIDSLKKLGFDAYPNRVYRLHKVPNDPYLNNQYYLSKISAFTGWEFEVGTSSLVTIAIIDSGIDGTHQDLSAKIHSFGNKKVNYLGSSINEDTSLIPSCYHATMVAGIASALTNNNTGIAGISWGAKLLSVDVFYGDTNCEPNTCNNCGTTDEAIIKAIDYIKTLHNTSMYGKIVANLSLGGAGSCSGPLQDAVNSAYNSGIIIVASAGNDGLDVNSPANCQKVIPVSATDENDKIASFSSRGSDMLNGVSAPGVNIYTTKPSNSYDSGNGTSFSAPIVSGLSALLWSYKPDYTNEQIKSLIKASADDLGQRGPDYEYGYGRVNVFRAMLLVNDELQNFIGENKIAAFPNPFYVNRDKYINFVIPQELIDSDLKIQIYNFNGDFITEFKTFSWDGKNSSGADVASGPYIVFVKSSKGKGKGKFVLIR